MGGGVGQGGRSEGVQGDRSGHLLALSFGPYFRVFLGLFWDHLWGRFGVILDPFGTILGRFCGHFQTISGTFGNMFGSFCGLFRHFLGPFCEHVGPFWGHSLSHFGAEKKSVLFARNRFLNPKSKKK